MKRILILFGVLGFVFFAGQVAVADQQQPRTPAEAKKTRLSGRKIDLAAP